MSAKLKPSTKVYEKDSRGKMTNRWKMQHHTPSGTKTDELLKMYNDPNFSRKKHLVKKELEKRGVVI